MADKKTPAERAIEAMQERPSITSMVGKAHTERRPRQKSVFKNASASPTGQEDRDIPASIRIDIKEVMEMAGQLETEYSKKGRLHIFVSRETRLKLLRLQAALNIDIPYSRLTEAIIMVVCDNINPKDKR